MWIQGTLDCACQAQDPEPLISMTSSPPAEDVVTEALAIAILQDGGRFSILVTTPPASESTKPIGPIPIPPPIPTPMLGAIGIPGCMAGIGCMGIGAIPWAAGWVGCGGGADGSGAAGTGEGIAAGRAHFCPVLAGASDCGSARMTSGSARSGVRDSLGRSARTTPAFSYQWRFFAFNLTRRADSSALDSVVVERVTM